MGGVGGLLPRVSGVPGTGVGIGEAISGYPELHQHGTAHYSSNSSDGSSNNEVL